MTSPSVVRCRYEWEVLNSLRRWCQGKRRQRWGLLNSGLAEQACHPRFGVWVLTKRKLSQGTVSRLDAGRELEAFRETIRGVVAVPKLSSVYRLQIHRPSPIILSRTVRLAFLQLDHWFSRWKNIWINFIVTLFHQVRPYSDNDKDWLRAMIAGIMRDRFHLPLILDARFGHE
jgi:hypothetical protein